MTLTELGWSGGWAELFQQAGVQGEVPARVLADGTHRYLVHNDETALRAAVSGAFRHTAADSSAYPTVGDWVRLRDTGGETAAITGTLPRATAVARRAVTGRGAGRDTPQRQILAANVDVLCIVAALDGGRNFNQRRLERYLALAFDAGARPVVVLNKADLAPDVAAMVAAAGDVAAETVVLAVSAHSGAGVTELLRLVPTGTTAAFVGPSGVGKSSLVNCLLGDETAATGEIRDADRRGRHTTSTRALFRIPGAGLVIDTPGLREVALWVDAASLDDVFAEVSQLSASCRFRDCSHQDEPGCAVVAAVAAGTLSAQRVESYHKLSREVAELERRKVLSGRVEERRAGRRSAKHRKSQSGRQRRDTNNPTS